MIDRIGFGIKLVVLAFYIIYKLHIALVKLLLFYELR